MADDLIGLGKFAEAAERSTREFRELVRDLLKPAVNELGAHFADQLRLYRAKAAMRAIQLAKEQIEASRLPQVPMTVKDLVLFLEGASLEEDSYLVSKWAGLISSAATTGDTLPAFSDILRQLSPEEARMLDFIADNGAPVHSDPDAVGVDKAALREASGLDPGRFIVRVQDLHRLEVVVQLTTSTIDPVRGFRGWGASGHVGLTALGEAFVKACRGPATVVSTKRDV